MVRGLAGISQDVPPYALVSGTNEIHGLNVVGMRRAGLSPATRKSVKAAYHKIFLAGMNLQAALDSTDLEDWDEEAKEFIDFFRVATKRGVCHP
jgi:UDP-N-acetylglucosamine acyltransferase